MDSNTRRLNGKLKDVLLDLHHTPYPHLPSPPDVKRRGAVALILRVNPSYAHWPDLETSDRQAGGDGDTPERLERFFAQEWVKNGHFEALFIKRAARKGDRWTGHIAFPGGMRDPEDEDDLAAAVRETSEEVGIDLGRPGVLQVGNLPQRVVTTHWGKKPLMTLCPYIFLITSHGIPPLKLQPTEVASAHWVPLKMLLEPANQADEYQDMSARLANQDFGVKRYLYRAAVGYMLFSAIRLMPSETLLSEPPQEPGSEAVTKQSDAAQSTLNRLGLTKTHTAAPDLLLWGLTLGIVADFLDFVSPQESGALWTHLWRYPTFSMPDVRFWVWAVGYRFRADKYRRIAEQTGRPHEPARIEVGSDSLPMPAAQDGSKAGTVLDEPGSRSRGETRSSMVGFMLEGYYDNMRKAVAVSLVCKAAAAAATVWWGVNAYRRR